MLKLQVNFSRLLFVFYFDLMSELNAIQTAALNDKHISLTMDKNPLPSRIDKTGLPKVSAKFQELLLYIFATLPRSHHRSQKQAGHSAEKVDEPIRVPDRAPGFSLFLYFSSRLTLAYFFSFMPLHLNRTNGSAQQEN